MKKCKSCLANGTTCVCCEELAEIDELAQRWLQEQERAYQRSNKRERVHPPPRWDVRERRVGWVPSFG